MRRLGVACVLLIAVAGCAESPAESATSSTREAVPLTTTEAPSSTTATPSTPSTRPQLSKVFHVETGPVDGQFTNGPLPVISGGVRPEASITLNGVELGISYCGDWLDWQSMYCFRHGHPFDDPPNGDVELDPGENRLTLRADFEDGETLEKTYTVFHDPSLIEVEGWLVDVASTDPPTLIIDLVELESGEDDAIDVLGEPERRVVRVTADAAFIVLAGDGYSARPDSVSSFDDLVDLVEREKNGESLDAVYWGRMLPEEIVVSENSDPMTWGVPSDILLTPDGDLKQMEQWWVP